MQVVRQSSDICGHSLHRIDLDEQLAPSDRGCARKAIQACKQMTEGHRGKSLVIVDVGAGQLVEPGFREFLKSSGAYPRRTIVVDCGERVFRERHGPNAINEVGRYYGLVSLSWIWEEARRHGLCVDTSERWSVEESAQQLRAILGRLVRTWALTV